MPNITYRESLPPEEWDRLIPLYTKLFPGVPIPPPQTARVAVAEKDGEIVGFWFFQLVAHLEPAGVDPAYSTEVSMNELRSSLHKSLAEFAGMEYYIYTATEEWDDALRSVGFRPIGLAYAANVPEVN